MNAAETVEKILEHHGVKGMHWGIRKDRSSNVSVSSRRKKIRTTGGFGHPAHPEAVRARTVGQIAKKSGHGALSNEELRIYQNRLTLEQSVKRLQYNEKSAAEKFVARALGRTGNQSVDKVGNAAASQIGKKALRLAAAA
jgi:hypothetical protein